MRNAKEIPKDRFARVLGHMPVVQVAKYRTTDQLGLFTDTFGPPEIRQRKSGTMLFWNFIRDDGARNFSLVSQVPEIRNATANIGRLEVEVRLVAKRGIRSFWFWTADRLAAIESGEELPTVLNGARFAVAPIR